MHLSFDRIKSVLNKYIPSVKGHRTLLVIYLFLYIAIFADYFRPLLHIGSLDFPDLGVFPLYPSQILDQNLYYWQLNGFGSPGAILPYSLIIFFLDHLFLNPSVAERIWIMSLLPIASIFIFYIAHNKFNIKVGFSMMFALLYAFNPVTVGLLYMGSVNDTLTMFVFEPILIIFVMNLISSNSYLDGIKWSLSFILAFYYVYSWSPEIVMWILPFLLISLVIWVIIGIRSSLQIRPAFFCTFFSLLSVLLITGNFQTILSILAGHGNDTLAMSGGTTNVSYLIVNLSDNFIGQLPYDYAIFAFFLFGLYLLLFRKAKAHLSILDLTLFLSSLTLVLIILITWTIFRFSIVYWEILLAQYIPEIAAYEPFFGITLLFSLFFIDLMVLWHAFEKASNIHLLKLSYSKSIITTKYHFSIQVIAIMIITFILLSSSVTYWRQDTPSTTDQLLNSNLAFDKYSVPSDYLTMSSWLNAHLSNSGGRFLLLPYTGLSNEAISTFIPEIPSVYLPDSIWSTILSAGNNTTALKSVSQELSLLGLKYIVINKGPYITGDSSASYTGIARISPSGFPWELTYLPTGSWQNWSMIFKGDPYLIPIINNDNWLVLENSLFSGLIHVYLVPNWLKLTDLYGFTQSYDCLYYSNESSIPLNFSIPQNNTFSENWSETIDSNGVNYNGGPLPLNMSYSNIWDSTFLMNNTYYNLNYSISGRNMSGAEIFIRFYSGFNLDGNVIGTYSSYSSTGNLTNKSYSYMFKTPNEFNSSAIFLTYLANPHVKYYEYSFHINFFKRLNKSPPGFGSWFEGYHYIDPTKISLDLNLSDNLSAIVMYSSSFNPAWSFETPNFSTRSRPLNISLGMEFNIFLVKNQSGEAFIEFGLQGQYVFSNYLNWSFIVMYALSLPLVSFFNKRRWTIGRR